MKNSQHLANEQSSPDITLYDKYNYDYSSYWKKRSYEHSAEVFVLHKFLSGLKGAWFIDIGGSYGRHIPQYHQSFKNSVLLDYSLNALKQAQKSLREAGISNVFLVAANAYHLPFKNSVFDGQMMVRVIHHLEKPEEVFREISRISSPQSSFILEYANKHHVKSLIKALVTANFSYITSPEPVSISTLNPEGSKKEDPGIIRNYSYSYIKAFLKENGFNIIKVRGVSFLRIPLLKRLVSDSILVFLEKVLQTLFGWSRITPSVFLLSKQLKSKSELQKEIDETNSIHTILQCPICCAELALESKTCSCTSCKAVFPVVDGIYDLRYPRPEECVR